MDLKIADDLWRSTMMPEGQFIRWRVADGAAVQADQVLAEIRIEDAVHEVVAPIGGRLQQMTSTHDIIEPGSLLGRLEPR